MRKKDYCIYTCIVGYYDALINLSFICDDYDYICFTNQKELLSRKYCGPWEIRPLLYDKLDSTRNNRWHKILGYYQLGDYISSIYIDSNIDVLSDYLYNLGKNTKNELLIPKHNQCLCIYDEIKRVSVRHLDNNNILEKLSHHLEQEGMPKLYGLTENNVLIRKHSSKLVYDIMCQWWSYLTMYSKRDQLSLTLVLWKYGMPLSRVIIPNVRSDFVNFKLYPHPGADILSLLRCVMIYLLRGYKPIQPYHLFIKVMPLAIKGTCRLIRKFVEHSSVF